MPQTDAVAGVPGVPSYTVTHIYGPQRNFALVIPVINENGRLVRQLERLKNHAPEVDIIVADGGSTDGSTELGRLKGLGVTSLLTKTDAGKLSAQLRMAFHHCLTHGYEAIVTMDGNDKDGVDGVSRIVTRLIQGYDFVQGSRFTFGGQAINTPWSRLIAIRVIHAPITSLAAGHWFTDTTNGFRGYSRRFLEDPAVAPFREEFQTYALLAYLPIRAARLGYRVTEVPVMRAYPSGEPVPTKIVGTSAHLRMLTILGKAALGCYNP